MGIAPELTEIAKSSTAWPFEEARKLVARLERRGPGKGDVLQGLNEPTRGGHELRHGLVATSTLRATPFKMVARSC